MQRGALLTLWNSGASIAFMNNILRIRQVLGLSQAAIGAAIGVSQGNISHYEQGRQEVPPDVARRLIAAAAERGHVLTFDDIYGAAATAEQAA